MPATSSMTTRLGSFPHMFSTTDDDHTPTKVTIIVTITDGQSGGVCPLPNAKNQQTQQNIAATVPPPLRIYPMPSVVVNSLWKSMGVVVEIIVVLKVAVVVEVVVWLNYQVAIGFIISLISGGACGAEKCFT